jgi:type IV pilus assembly protein PilB
MKGGPAAGGPRTSIPGGAAAAGPGERKIPIDPEAVREFLLAKRLVGDANVARSLSERLVGVEFPAQATILRAGAPAEWVGILYQGKASVLSVNAASGARTTLEALRPGDLLGEVGPLVGGAHPHQVMADESCVVLRIPLELLEALFARDPAFVQSLARQLAMRVVKLGMFVLRSGGTEPAPAAERATRAPTPAPQGAAMRPGALIAFVEVAEFDPDAKLVALVPEKLIVEHRLLPLKLEGSRLTVGMVAPRNAVALADLRRVLHGFDVDVLAIGADDFDDWVVRLRVQTAAPGDPRAGGAALKPEQLAFDVTDSEREADKALRIIGDEVIRCVNRIVCAALEREASDVHIEPDSAGVKIRFRVHGMLQDWSEYVPVAFAKGIVARLKVLAGLDITEKRLPQDGRIAVTAGRREVDMRVSSLPMSRGEKVVLRIFEAAGMLRPLEQTFAEPDVLATVRDALGRKTGAILIGGATGSGKSTTLYSMINQRRKLAPDQNVLMVEDPIEYRLQGVTQVQVNHQVGLGFAQVLRAMLRQDPDVIALGETRDTETARMALEAAMTGHLVLTSIHTRDAISAVQRLETLDCPRELIAQSLSLVLVQRLVRKLCPACTRLEPPSPVLQESLAARKLVQPGTRLNLPRAVGCEKCGQVGYVGRVAVIEALQVTDEIRDAIMTHQPLSEVARLAAASDALYSFQRYAAYLMARPLISAADALMAVAG